YVGYSKGQIDREGRTGWRKQQTIPATNNTKVLITYVLALFREHYLAGTDVRQLGLSYGKLVWNESLQLDLFSEPEEQISEMELNYLI
ncbi:excinuclease ABC subunit A, partial [Enterococcus faecium]